MEIIFSTEDKDVLLRYLMVMQKENGKNQDPLLNSLIGRIESLGNVYFPTGVDNIDFMIMHLLDDETLFGLCSSNKYLAGLCNNDSFWYSRIIGRWPFKGNLSVYKPNNMTYKQIYKQMISNSTDPLEVSIKLGLTPLVKSLWSKRDKFIPKAVINMAANNGFLDTLLYMIENVRDESELSHIVTPSVWWAAAREQNIKFISYIIEKFSQMDKSIYFQTIFASLNELNLDNELLLKLLVDYHLIDKDLILDIIANYSIDERNILYILEKYPEWFDDLLYEWIDADFSTLSAEKLMKAFGLYYKSIENLPIIAHLELLTFHESYDLNRGTSYRVGLLLRAYYNLMKENNSWKTFPQDFFLAAARALPRTIVEYIYDRTEKSSKVDLIMGKVKKLDDSYRRDNPDWEEEFLSPG